MGGGEGGHLGCHFWSLSSRRRRFMVVLGAVGRVSRLWVLGMGDGARARSRASFARVSGVQGRSGLPQAGHMEVGSAREVAVPRWRQTEQSTVTVMESGVAIRAAPRSLLFLPVAAPAPGLAAGLAPLLADVDWWIVLADDVVVVRAGWQYVGRVGAVAAVLGWCWGGFGPHEGGQSVESSRCWHGDLHPPW